MALRFGLRLGLGSMGGGGESPDMILVYAIPDPNTNIQLAIQANSTWFGSGQSVNIYWGDGSDETVSATSGHTGYIGHTYTAARTYTVKISGSMTMYGRIPSGTIVGQTLLTRVDSFGKLGIESLTSAFRSCTGLTSVTRTLPSGVTDMSYMFFGCSGAAFNPDVSNWDVSKVTNMNYMFSNCSGAGFRGGRGVSGNGIANWWLRMSGVNMVALMLNSKTQEPAFLDEILNAWAALHANGQLPTKITVNFGTNNKYTAAGAAAYTTLTDTVANGGAEWTIASGGLAS